MRRGTSFIAGPPTGRPRPGLVTTPTPSPPSNSSPGSSLNETRAVRCAPCVTSGSSPASFTTTASAHVSPTSHLSTSKDTRRSLPFLGSLTSTVSCGSPVSRAFAAALAAAAAQVPVVQPVLSFSSFALAMLEGMAGSCSLRLGDIGLLVAEHVGEVRAVKVGACPAGRQPRTNQDKRLPLYASLPDAVGEFLEETLDDQLIRPAGPVDHGARCSRRVSALDELLLQSARACGGEEDRHRRPVRSETLYVLPLRHRGAAGPARQDHRLRDLWYCQLSPKGGRRSPQGRDARHYLPLQPQLLAQLYLLQNRTVDARVARVNPCHPEVLGDRPLVEYAHRFERDRCGLDDLSSRAGMLQNAVVHKAASPDHDVSLANDSRSPHR